MCKGQGVGCAGKLCREAAQRVMLLLLLLLLLLLHCYRQRHKQLRQRRCVVTRSVLLLSVHDWMPQHEGSVSVSVGGGCLQPQMLHSRLHHQQQQQQQQRCQ